MKVLEVIRQGEIGGGESHVLDLVAGLDKALVTPIVMAFTHGHMIETLERQGVKCHVIETQSAFDPKVQSKIKEVVRREGIELIHAHGSRAASNMLWTAWQLRLPMIYTVHGWSFHQDQPRLIQTLRAWSEWLICRCSKQVICVSDSNFLSGKEAFGLKSCRVIENGVNLKRFDAAATYDDLRTHFGFTPTDKVVALIARVTLQKDPMSFIRGIAMAHEKDARIKGLLVGEGDLKEEADRYICEHHLSDCIRTAPFRTDIPAVLHAIDIYCLPSLWEGLSIALLEAMAMKKPIIVTPTDGSRELITHRHNGLIVPFRSPEEIAAACLQYACNPQLMASCGEAAWQLVKQRFDSQRVSDSVTQIYQQTLTP